MSQSRSTKPNPLFAIFPFCCFFAAASLLAPKAFAASATDTIKAASFSGQSGVTTETCSEGGQNVTSIEAGDHIYFSNMDFGASGIQCFEARVAGYGNGGFIELRLDAPTGTLIGTCEILPPTGGWQTWTNKACKVTGVTGPHTLYLVFAGGVGAYSIKKLFDLNWFKFHGTPEITTANWRQSTSSQKGIFKGALPLSAASGTPVVEIFPDSMFLRVDGFGGAFNENGWHCLTSLSDTVRTAIQRDLYDPKTGCRFNIGRVPIGMNDFTITRVYSLNETPGDTAMKNFSLKNDSAMNIAYVKAAMAINPNIMLHAAPWTPPSWMKTNNDWQGTGTPTIIKTPQIYRAYALYFSKFVKGWQNAGMSVNIVYPQNEPGWTNDSHPSCSWNGESLKNWVRDYLYPRFVADSITTQIWLGTFNKSNYGDDIRPLLEDTVARKMVTGIGTQREVNNGMAEATKNSFYKALHYHGMQTETMCWEGANNWEDAMKTFKEFHDHFSANTQSYTMWNMILDSDYGFVTWMYRDQNSMISVTPATGLVKYNHEFYIVKHWSHYIRIGAARLHAANNNTASLRAMAFKNPDGSVILVLQNNASATVSPMIKIGSKMFTPTLPASSVNTFNIGGTENTENWPGSPRGQVNPYKRIEAESISQSSPDVRIETSNDVDGVQHVGYIGNNAFIAFDSLNFNGGVVACSLRVANAGGSASSVEIRLDSLNGTEIGTATIPNAGDWKIWTTIACTLTPVTNVHNVYLVFKTSSSYACNINWLVFKGASISVVKKVSVGVLSQPSVRQINGKTVVTLAKQGNYSITVTGLDGKRLLSLSGDAGTVSKMNGADRIRAGVYFVAVEQNGLKSVGKVVNPTGVGSLIIR